MDNQQVVQAWKAEAVTDVVKIDCFAIGSHSQLWTLPLLGALLLRPDITNRVCATVPLTVEWSRKGSQHIWLLDVESGRHYR